MRWKKIFVFAVLLLFLAVQTVPLMATDTVGSKVPTIAAPNHNDGGGDGDGEEHPWQDDSGDNTGTMSFSKSLDWLIGLFFNKNNEGNRTLEKNNDQRNTRKPYKKFAPVQKDKQK